MQPLYRQCAPYLATLIAGRPADLHVQRGLILAIKRDMQVRPTPFHWLLLSLLYRTRRAKQTAVRHALRLDPGNPEAHAELADLIARSDPSAAAAHLEAALSNLRGYDLEEEILYDVALVAQTIRAPGIAERAARRGRRKFPGSSFFR